MRRSVKIAAGMVGPAIAVVRAVHEWRPMTLDQWILLVVVAASTLYGIYELTQLLRGFHRRLSALEAAPALSERRVAELIEASGVREERVRELVQESAAKLWAQNDVNLKRFNAIEAQLPRRGEGPTDAGRS